MPQVLVFDTGPLWELLLYQAVRSPLRFASLRTELTYLRTSSSYESLSRFIGGFQRRTTTPHVVAEISARILNRTQPKGQPELWALLYEDFRSMGMDEALLKLLEMPQPLVASFGAVDSSVLECARKVSGSTALVLSIDGALIAECRRAGIDAKHLSEVIA